MTRLERRRRIRLAYVTASLDLGGSERQMLILARNLPRERFEVDFVLLTRAGTLADEALRAGAGVHVLDAPRRGTMSYPRWALRVAGTVLRFIRLARARRYDVIDAWLFNAYGMAAITRPITRVPVLISGRRSLSDYKEHFGPLQRLVDRIARAWSDAFVANSQEVADDVRRREGLTDGRLRIIRNAVELPPELDPDRRRQVRQEWGIDEEDALVVGCVANYKPGKGLELLIDAFAALDSTPPHPHLVLIGEGSLREHLTARARGAGVADRVHLVGATPDPRPLYAAFDIAVLASDSEGLPNVLLEAAAAGRPLVGTDAGGSREIVIDGETGLLVPIGDREALTGAIRALLESRSRREELGEGARRRIMEDFGVDRCVAQFVSLYEALVAGAGR